MAGDQDPQPVQGSVDQAVANRTTSTTPQPTEVQASSDLLKQQRDAEARQAIAEAQQAARAASIAIDPGLERAQKEAEARKTIAEANKAVSGARQAEIAALIPDLSKVQIPDTKVEGDQVLRGNDLVRHALRAAATKLAHDVKDRLSSATGKPARVLITSDADLASADGAYIELKHGLKRLAASADALLPRARAPGLAPLLAIAGAVAGAIPGLISAFAPHRSVASRAIPGDDVAAVAEVAGALAIAGCTVQIDDFRLVPETEIVKEERALRENRDRLARFKLEQEQIKTQRDTVRAVAEERLAALLKTKDSPPTAGVPPALDATISEVRKERDEAAAATATATVNAETADTLVSAIDAFFVAMHTVPQGAKRSQFVSAALHETLRGVGSNASAYTGVLFVKASGGTVDQYLEKKFLAKDRVSVIASVSVSYWLMDPATSNIVAGGAATASTELTGRLGEELKIRAIPS